jgi:subtilase family serine protease
MVEESIMKQGHFILSAAIATALASVPGAPRAYDASSASIGNNVSEAARVTQAVTNDSLFKIPKTHPAFVSKASSSTQPLAGSVKISHLQLVLKPSAMRQAAMEALIADQHNPKSARFQKWLTPQQFGESFGVVDSDIAAVTSWLTSQGFAVNNVYPNKTQIDFSGTVAQVDQAFHTQENSYAINGGRHRANASDISIPAALQSVVAGVMGLDDFHSEPLVKKPHIAQWQASKKGFASGTAKSAGTGKKGMPQTIGVAGFLGPERGLAPNDLATIYGIKTIRSNGVTGKGINIAVVESYDMVSDDWANFVSVFNLAKYGGTFRQFNPTPISGPTNCLDPSAVAGYDEDGGETLLDAEWSTAIAPGANIWVAACADDDADGNPQTNDFYGGMFIAATNLINSNSRPDVISASYAFGEFSTDIASKTAIDLMWAQADAEGISVFVASGDSGSNPSFNNSIINGFQGDSGVGANSLATSPHDTAVGGTDFADVLRGTTNQYFAPSPSVVGGSALSYVPEIPWNNSCGNGVAAKAAGFNSAIDFCKEYLVYDRTGDSVTSEAGSGGPSSVDIKPAWQRQIYNAAQDQSRDVPDVSLFAGAFNGATWVITCTAYYHCSPDFSGSIALSGGTSVSSPMFAGIQALIDQGLADRGMPADQGNAAPTLYALAAQEYGSATGQAPASLAACSADNGTNGTDNCVFHNITSGSISSQCLQQSTSPEPIYTANCYYYGKVGYSELGLTTSDAVPTDYTPNNKAFSAQPGWSFASGLGSVNTRNLLIAWRAFVNAPAAAPLTN